MKKILLLLFVILAKISFGQQPRTKTYAPVNKICSQFKLSKEQSLVVEMIYLNDWQLLKQIGSDTTLSNVKNRTLTDLKKNAFDNGRKLFSEEQAIRILSALVMLTRKGKIHQDSILNYNLDLIKHPVKGAHFKSDTVIKYNTKINSN